MAQPDAICNALVNKSDTTPGQWLHSVAADGFLWLYRASPDVHASDTVVVERANEPAKPDMIIVHVGHRDALAFRVTADGCLARNVPVYAGEEVWVRATKPGSHTVYGFVSARPLV